MVSIPAGWIKNNGIKQHDYLIIVEKPDHLIIKKNKGDRKVAVIDLDTVNDNKIMLRYMIDTYYIHGADMIKVTSKKPIDSSARREILDYMSKLVGVKVYEVNINSIILEINDGINTLSLDKFHKNINKILMLILLILNNVKILLDENINIDLQLLFSELFENVESINYRYKYVVRLLYKMSIDYEYNIFNSMRELVIYVLIMRDLERMVHHIKSLILNIKSMYESFRDRNVTRVKATINELINDIIVIINQLDEYLVSGDLSYIPKIRDLIDDVKQKLLSIMNANDNNLLVHATFYELRRILGYCVALFDDISHLYLIPSYENA